MMNGAWHWGWGVMGFLWMLLVWGGIIVLIWWGIRTLAQGGERRRNPLEIAKERYARGEITREQYEQLRKDLT
ncbi:MAG: SHOCT domain-containing protein [Chloroflexi bacterium]|nr:SHOCT domain-containing protein [Chloroflexota bacterium]